MARPANLVRRVFSFMNIFTHIATETASASSYYDGEDYKVRCLLHSQKRPPKRKHKRNEHRRLRRMKARNAAIRQYFHDLGVVIPTDCDPNFLRSEALQRKITLGELAVICINISKHRGLTPNHTGHRDRIQLSSIAMNDAALEKQRKTPGEYYYEQQLWPHQFRDLRTADGPCRSFSRKAVEAEFDAIWDRQYEWGATPEDGFKFVTLREIIFQQNAPSVKLSRVNNCIVRPKRKATYKARRQYQQLLVERQLDRVCCYAYNAMEITPVKIPLPKEVRAKLVKRAMAGINTSWRSVNNMLYRFGLETYNQEYKVSVTDKKYRRANSNWSKLKPAMRDKIVDLMLRAQECGWDTGKKWAVLEKVCKLSSNEARAYAEVMLPVDRCEYSVAALNAMIEGRKPPVEKTLKQAKIYQYYGFRYARTQTANHKFLARIYAAMKQFDEHANHTNVIVIGASWDDGHQKSVNHAIEELNNRQMLPSPMNVLKIRCYEAQSHHLFYNKNYINGINQVSDLVARPIFPEWLLCDDSPANWVVDTAETQREVTDQPTDWADIKSRIGDMVHERCKAFRLDGASQYTHRLNSYLKFGPPSFCHLDETELGVFSTLLLDAFKAEVAFRGLNIPVIAVNVDLITRLRRRFGLHESLESNAQQAVGACLLTAAASDDYATIIQHTTRDVRKMAAAAERTCYEQTVQRAGRTQNKNNVIYIADDHKKRRNIHSYVEWQRIMLTSKHGGWRPKLLAELRLHDTIRVERGGNVEYYFMSSTRGPKFKESAYLLGHRVRASKLNIMSKKFKLVPPTADQLKSGIRLVCVDLTAKLN